MATSCYGRISESGNRVTFVISAVRRTSAQQTLENGSTAEPLRHRQTKGAETDMLDLTPPRHVSTLPTPAVRFAQIAAIGVCEVRVRDGAPIHRQCKGARRTSDAGGAISGARKLDEPADICWPEALSPNVVRGAHKKSCETVAEAVRFVMECNRPFTAFEVGRSPGTGGMRQAAVLLSRYRDGLAHIDRVYQIDPLRFRAGLARQNVSAMIPPISLWIALRASIEASDSV